MTEVEKLTFEKEFLFKWLIDMINEKSSQKGNDSMEELVQNAVDDFIRIKNELKQ